MNGSQGVLITNDGDHSPTDWAMATADHLVHVTPGASADVVLEARKLEVAIASALVPHHDKVQTHERGHLAAKGDEHLATPLDPTQHVEEAVQAVIACAVGTRFEAKFREPAVQNMLRQQIASHFATSMHNARSWHVDRNPDGPNARAFKAAHHGG